jgi:hypothetical protein
VGLYKRLAKFDAISSQDPNVALFTYSSKKLCSFLVCFDELLRSTDGDTVDAALHHLDSLVADTSRLLDRAVAIDGLDGGWRNVKTMTLSILLEDLPHLLHDAHEGDDIHGTRLHVSWEAVADSSKFVPAGVDGLLIGRGKVRGYSKDVHGFDGEGGLCN